jgi:hypothetical protein
MNHGKVLLLCATAVIVNALFAENAESAQEVLSVTSDQREPKATNNLIFCRYCSKPFFKTEVAAWRAHEKICPKNPRRNEE